MFRHLLSYSCRQLFRTREVIFWTLLFPVLLATFNEYGFERSVMQRKKGHHPGGPL